MEVQQLKYFIATAESGSASRAAARCQVSQPSLSQQIKKLEDSLGVRLFDRLRSGMVMTDAGRALLPRARTILGEVRHVEESLGRDIDEGGSLAIGAIPTIAPYVLPGALRQMRRAAPGCQITIREDRTENLLEALLDQEIECALLGTLESEELVDTEVIGREELVVLMPPGPEAIGVVAPADLRDKPRISLHEEHCLGRQIEGFCAGRGIMPRIVCRTTQLGTIFELVSSGLGISIVPEMAVAHARSKFRVAKFGRSRPERPIVLAWHRHRTRSAAALKFAGFVRERLKEMAAG